MITELINAAPLTECQVFCNPDQPSQPFGTPLLAVWDTLRVLSILAGFIVLALLPTVIGRVRTHGQRARFIGLGIAAAVVIDTEINHIGDYASVRLALAVAAMAFSAYGLIAARTEQFPRDTPRPGRDAA
jgi:hypothetical protein